MQLAAFGHVKSAGMGPCGKKDFLFFFTKVVISTTVCTKWGLVET